MRLFLCVLLCAAALRASAQGTFTDISSLGDGSPLNNAVAHTAVGPDGALYVAGPFTQAGGRRVAGIARWDSTGWQGLIGGTELPDITDLAVGADGDLYASGTFETISGVAAAHVARWDGAAWHPLGAGLDGDVSALLVEPDGAILAGGAFGRAGTAEAQRVARWDGAAWSAVLPLVHPDSTWTSVRDLAAGPGGSLYAIGSQPVRQSGFVSRIDGGLVRPLDGGIASYATGEHLAVGLDGTVYVGGRIDGGFRVYYGALQWRGDGWETIGAGVPASRFTAVQAVAIGADGSLLLGVESSILGSPVPSRVQVQRWDGEAWSLVADANQGLRSFAVGSEGDLYVGGAFSYIGGAAARGIARWTGGTWSGYGSRFDDTVASLAVAPGGDLYAAGAFQTAGGVVARGVARHSDGGWQRLGDGLTGARQVVVSSDGTPYAVATFRDASGYPESSIGRWDGASWQSIHANVLDGVTLAAGRNGEVYAAGRFASIGGVPALNVARWDGAQWHALGAGLAADQPEYTNIYTVSVGADGALYAQGDFRRSGDIPLGGAARWDGTAWTSLATVALTPTGGAGGVLDGTLYATGAAADGIGVFRLDGGAWSRLGGPWPQESYFYSLALVQDGTLVVAGDFAGTPGGPARNLARWDGAAWQPVGDGTDGGIEVLATGVDGELYLGGAFQRAGDVASPYVARYDAAPVAVAPAPTEARVRLSVGPNPARGAATAFVTSDMRASVEILDALGRVVGTAEAPAGVRVPVRLPTARLAPGVYAVRVSGTSVQSARLVVVR